MPKKQITVRFDEIFYFAEKPPYKVGWNACNDLFFNDILTYKQTNHIYKEDLKHDLQYDLEHPESKYPYTKDQRLSREIIIAFMEENKLEEILVLND